MVVLAGGATPDEVPATLRASDIVIVSPCSAKTSIAAMPSAWLRKKATQRRT